jgi:hypothetical protein
MDGSLSGRRLDGQAHDEARARVRCGEFQRAAVVFDDAAHDREPQAGAVGLYREVRREDLFAILARSRARIRTAISTCPSSLHLERAFCRPSPRTF